MKVRVEIPLHETRDYIEDFDEETIPDVGDRFDENRIKKDKRSKRKRSVLFRKWYEFD